MVSPMSRVAAVVNDAHVGKALRLLHADPFATGPSTSSREVDAITLCDGSSGTSWFARWKCQGVSRWSEVGPVGASRRSPRTELRPPGQDDKIINKPHIPKLKEPAQPRKGFVEGDLVKVRDQLEPGLRTLPSSIRDRWRIDTEVLPLLWRQVDFGAGEVRIDDPRSTKRASPGVSLYTGSSTHPRGQRKLTEGLDSQYVFCHLAGVRAGKRFSYSGFYKAWQRAVRAAGVARIPHDFRRTAIRTRARRRAPLGSDGDGGPEDGGGLSPVCNRGRGDDPRSCDQDEPRCKGTASHYRNASTTCQQPGPVDAADR